MLGEQVPVSKGENVTANKSVAMLIKALSHLIRLTCSCHVFNISLFGA